MTRSSSLAVVLTGLLLALAGSVRGRCPTARVWDHGKGHKGRLPYQTKPWPSKAPCPGSLHPLFQDDPSSLQSLIAKLPKAELHIHIEGTLEPELMFKLADRNNISLPYANLDEAKKARSNFTCLQDFLDAFNNASVVLRTQHDFYDLTEAYLQQAAANNIKHVEIFFDAQTHIDRGVPISEVVDGMQAAMDAAQQNATHPISSRLILCLVRNKGAAAAGLVLLKALPYLPEIQTLGLASTEVPYPPSMFTTVYRAAGLLGLHKVAHAGEEGGPDYVWEAIQKLQVQRVDHGIRSLEDASLVEYMAQQQLPITLCPLSNLHLKVYAGQLEERICDMLSSGIPVTLNSDDPAYLGGYVNANYAWVAQVAGLGPEALAGLAKNSFQASFIDQEAKEELMAEVDAALASWQREREGRVGPAGPGRQWEADERQQQDWGVVTAAR